MADNSNTTVWILDHEIQDYDESGAQVQGVFSTHQRAMDAAQKYTRDTHDNQDRPTELHNGCTSIDLVWNEIVHQAGGTRTVYDARDPHMRHGLYTVYPMTIDEE